MMTCPLLRQWHIQQPEMKMASKGDTESQVLLLAEFHVLVDGIAEIGFCVHLQPCNKLVSCHLIEVFFTCLLGS